MSDPCLAVACENDEGIGRPCTAGGGECDDLGFGVVCTVDFEPEADLAMCTKVCFTDGPCGTGASCYGDPDDPGLGNGCVPDACIPEMP